VHHSLDMYSEYTVVMYREYAEHLITVCVAQDLLVVVFIIYILQLKVVGHSAV